LRQAIAHAFGDQVLLISNDLILAFGHLVELFVFSSYFSFAQAIRVLVLPIHSSRGRMRTQG
jgi:hypothetical protein